MIDDVTLFSELVYDYGAQENSEDSDECENDESEHGLEDGEQSASEAPTPVKSKRVPKQKPF